MAVNSTASSELQVELLPRLSRNLSHCCEKGLSAPGVGFSNFDTNYLFFSSISRTKRLRMWSFWYDKWFCSFKNLSRVLPNLRLNAKVSFDGGGGARDQCGIPAFAEGWLQTNSAVTTTLAKKKEPSARFAARRTLFHVWYQARSAQGKSRGQSRIGLALRWSRLIEHDITRGTAFFSPRISMMVLFFGQGSSTVFLGPVFRCQWGKHEGFVKYFFRLRSNGKEKRVIFFNFRQPPNTLHIHSSNRERTWPEAHCHVYDCRAFSTMVVCV